MPLPSYDELVGTLPSYDELVKTDEESSDTFAQDEPKTAADLMSGRFTEEQRRNAAKRIHIPTINEVGVIPAQIIEAALKYASPVGWAQMASEAIEPGNPLAKITKGAISGVSNTLAGFTTPEGLSTLAIMPQSRIGQILLGLGFEAKAVADVPAQVKAYGATDDPQEKAKIATEIAASVGLPAMAVAHGVSPRAEAPQGPRRWPEPDAPIETELVKTTEQVAAQSDTAATPQSPVRSADNHTQSETVAPSGVVRQLEAAFVPESVPRPIDPGIEAAIAEIQRRNAPADAQTQFSAEDSSQVAPSPPEPSAVKEQVVETGLPQKPAVSSHPEPSITTGVANRVLKAEAEPTGISNRALEEIYGDAAPVPGTGKGPKEWKAIGQARLDNFQRRGIAGDDPYAVLTNLREGKTAVSQIPADVSLLRAEHQRLVETARQSEGTPEYGARAQAAFDMAKAIKEVAHGPASDVFRAIQEHDQPRYDNVTDFDQAWRERERRESTLAEKAQFQKVAGDVRQAKNGANAEIEAAQGRVQRYRARESVSVDDAAKNIHDQITELTKDCAL
jgi:hypothetical protein